MLEKVIAFALRQRIFIIVVSGLLLIAGVFAALDLPVEAFPDVQDVQVQVVTQWPGMAPQEVERSISEPIEREMSGVPHLIQLRSVSITGLSVVTITFADGTDDYFARQQVLEKLQDVTLPTGIQPSLAPLSSAVGEIYRYVLKAPPGASLSEVRSVQDWVVRPALRQTEGVADVVSFGGSIREYQVEADPVLLRKYGVSLDQVAQALGAGSANAGGGLITAGDQSLVVRAVGLFEKAGDIAQVPVAVYGGHPILVGDIGAVKIGERVRSGIVAYNDADDVVEGIVDMTRGQDPAKVIAGLKQRIAELRTRLPAGYSIETIYDRTQLVDHTVRTVAENLLTGALLVIGILVIFLRSWRTALIVAGIIPLSLLSAFIVIDARGMSANLISLGAVDFGIIIDSAVVLVEALMVRLARDTFTASASESLLKHRMLLLRQTVTLFGKPVLFSKAIIILAFLPIFTFQRVEGKIFAPMALTLSFALLGAIALTLTLIPALLSFNLRGNALVERHSAWLQRLQDRYRRLIAEVLVHQRKVIAGSVFVLLLALLLAPRLGSEFLPRLDEGNIWLTISLPPATDLQRTKEIERAVRGILRSYPEIGDVITQVGRPDDGTDPKGPNNLEILADLHPASTWHYADKEALIADIGAKIHRIPGVPTNFSQVIQDNVEEALSGVKGEIAVKIFGTDLDVLEQKGQQIAVILNSIRGASDVAVNRIGGQAELNIALDRAAMARLGLNIGDVTATVQTALGGAAVNSFYEGERRYDVTLRLAGERRASVDDVRNLPVHLPTGDSVPLDSIATVGVREGAARIMREAGGRNVAVKANLLGRDQGSFVDEAMHRVAREVTLPEGYRITWGGQFENQQRAMKRLAVIVPLSLCGIFLLLFWSFRSLRLAALVLSLVPFTLIGGLGGLAAAGLHLSVSAAVGFIAVAGISVQNGVIMVEQVVELYQNGRSFADSVTEGAVLRLRPILMTALMAGLGLLPAALSHGIGSETQRPFAVVIVGGIVSATLFTLLLMPPLLIRLRPKPAATAT
ncbi:MAG: efflux RND transporter permease subunit [Nevskiaceae bacterium]|nr:MAG: efflux RND transporter permease subunit [Nevskiaceae bacterium]